MKTNVLFIKYKNYFKFAIIVSFTVFLFSSCKNKTSKITVANFVDDLNLQKMMRPVDSTVFQFTEEGYATWDATIFKENDVYYMIYSRWKNDWLKESEIAIAKSSFLEGPYKHVKVLLQGRGKGYWDELSAHNPKLKKFGNTYYLYYISSKSGKTRSHTRDSQRTGVATSKKLMGPYTHSNAPIVEPSKPVFNITVNPDVVKRPDGKYLMILKGDKKQKTPEEKMGQRVQGIALSDSPIGPFIIQPKLAIKDFDTEDASIWYDKKRALFYAIFHAHKYVGLIVSKDGIHWKKAKNGLVTKKSILTQKGDTLQLNCIERPSVYFENNKPTAINLSVRRARTYNTGSCITIPLSE